VAFNIIRERTVLSPECPFYCKADVVVMERKVSLPYAVKSTMSKLTKEKKDDPVCDQRRYI
jgi:hypothetical protein